MGGIRTLDDFQSCMIFHLLKRHPMANCSDAPLPFVASHHGKLNSPEVWNWTKHNTSAVCIWSISVLWKSWHPDLPLCPEKIDPTNLLHFQTAGKSVIIWHLYIPSETGCHRPANGCPRTKTHLRQGLTKFTIINFVFDNRMTLVSTVGFEPTPSTTYGQVLPHYTMQISLTVSTNVDQPFCNVACLTSCKKAIHSRIELLPPTQLLGVHVLNPDSITPVYLFSVFTTSSQI